MKTLLTDISNNQCKHVHLEPEEKNIGEICVVGFGNPLHVSDSIGLLVVSKLKEQLLSYVCCLNLESYCGYLAKILHSHKNVVIVDSVANLDCGDSIFVEVDSAVLDNSSKMISASHGLSWMDELRLANLEENKVFFYGASGQHKSEIDKLSLDNYLKRLGKFVDLLHNERSIQFLTKEL